ncbi:DEAD/DEAH box helicase [Anaeromyxobacter oryzisoli]|uniref:DEAD/DEAH box helicase n=1 Tax=Anaeromyxobacter oryzisoli TaxID=2925408 RepID=UPI001F5A0691|nr:DEAD/DEAH box helicase [Anaeromyxobacter sp. SG63]
MPEAARRAAPPRAPTLVERLTPEAVHAAFSEAAIVEGRDVIEEGRASRPEIRPSSVEAIVVGEDRMARRVALAWGDRGLTTSCSCGRPRCAHAAALALLLAGDARPAGPDARPVASLRDEERRRRQARGASELFDIHRVGGSRLLGQYEVASPSSQAYRVTLRSLDAPHNGCTCPDFATNLLGTCKHVEAVLHHLRRDAPRRLARAAGEGAPASYLHLVFEPEESIGLHQAPEAPARRFAARYFAPDGRLRGAVAEVWPELSRDAVEAGVEVPAEVTRLAERAIDAARRERRRRQVEEEVRAAGRDQPGLRLPLYPYQVEGVAFLASRGRALLADEMGLGKTAQAIAAMAVLARRGEVRRTLVVCPTSLKHQWLRELRQFADLAPEEVVVVSGGREERRARYADPPRVLVTSYELARADERELLDLAPDLLVLDEAQRIKNWRTRTASVVKRIPSRFAFVLTGTPLENRLDDLYSLMQVVDPHLFGPLWRFNEEFTTLDPSGKPAGYRNLDRLRSRIAPVVLRRRKEEVLADLPERLVSRLVVPLSPEQREIHDDAEAGAARLLSVLRKRPLTPAEEQRLMRAFQRMRMACDAAALVDGDTPGAPKLDELERLLEEICVEEGRKVVVFSEWEKMQAMAAEVCARLGVGHVRLHGGVPSEARGALIDRFRDDPACRVFLSTDAGGVGLNLQVATHVVNLDLPWNPAVLAQRIARVHRLGQREPVNVVTLVSEGSFEERLEASLDSKRALFAAAVGDDPDTVTVERSSLARRLATVLEESRPVSSERPDGSAEPDAEPVEALRARVGDALEQVVRLADGRIVGVVRGEVPDAAPQGAVLLPARVAEGMAPLGGASPLAGAEVLYRAPAVGSADARAAARRGLVAVAARKRAAAEALVAAGQPAEVLGLCRDAIAFALRALDPRGDPGEDPAALLAAVHGHLVPAGLVSEGEAGALARASEAARAFGAAAIPPPEPLVAAVVADARALVGRARAAIEAG